MKSTICKAIADQKTIGFTYKSVQRLVEPHCYGIQHNGREGLCAWQLTGGSGDGYRMFLIDEISGANIGDSFAGPRLNYRRGDSRFAVIYAEL